MSEKKGCAQRDHDCRKVRRIFDEFLSKFWNLNFTSRAFERAFQIYQNEQFLKEIRNKDSKRNKENLESQKNSANIKKLITNDANSTDDLSNNCLIDLGSEIGPQLNSLYCKDQQREYFQTTWVSFEWKIDKLPEKVVLIKLSINLNELL